MADPAVPRAGFSRRTFLAGAGSIAVSFSLLGRAGAADAATRRAGQLRIDPDADPSTEQHWLVLAPGAITVYAGKVELGTGIRTSLAQVVVEELRLDVADVGWVQGDTRLCPTQGTTAGSKSLQNGGPQLRAAAATAYAALLGLAAQHFGIDKSGITASNGEFSARYRGGVVRRVSYDDLLRGTWIDLASDPAAPLVPPEQYVVVGQSHPRMDLPAKIDTSFRYVHDIVLPGMLHGRVVRPPGRNATAPQISNLARAQAIPGFRQAVAIDRFVGVVADSEWAAIRATDPSYGITVSWTPGPPLLAEAQLPQLLRDPANHYREVVEVNQGDVDAAFSVAPKVVEAGYFTPFQMHGAMGPSASVADVRPAPDPGTGVQATIYSSSQNVTALRGAIARLLGYANDQAVHVIYEEASGCYGHNGADDVAADAALLSRAVGAPVRVQWKRQDEHGWEPLGSAQAHDMKGSIGAGGITGWLHRVYAPTATSRPSATNSGTLLAGALTGGLPGNLPTTAGNLSGRNCPVTYVFANQRVESRLVKSFETAGPTSNVPVAPLRYRFPRTSSLRSLGGFSNSFANESFFDELAHSQGFDPLQLRIDSHTDQRALAVLEALRPAWAARPRWQRGRGAGVAYQQYETDDAYVATYVEVTVDMATGVVRVARVVCAHDCGLIVNPDGLRNQIEGNVIQGISRTLKEEVHYVEDRVTTIVWESDVFPTGQYAVLSFDEVPPIETILIDRPQEPALGAGEPAIGTLGGAIGNALFAATGVRMRSLPMTPVRVKAAIDASNVRPPG